MGESRGVELLRSWCRDEDEQAAEAVSQVVCLSFLECDLSFLVKRGAIQGQVFVEWLRRGPSPTVETLEWGGIGFVEGS